MKNRNFKLIAVLATVALSATVGGVVTNQVFPTEAVPTSAEETSSKGYMLTIYNEDGTVGHVIDGSKSISEFNVNSALTDAYTFGDNAFLFGITGTPTYELQLLQDVEMTEMFAIAADKNVIVDLNGHNITSGYQTDSTTKHIYPFDVYGNFTIEDSVGTGSITGRGIYAQDGCTLTVNGGSIIAIDANGGSAFFQYGGDIIVNGGTIWQNAEGTYNFALNSRGGTATVNGGTVKGNHGAVAADGGAVVLNDGTFICTGSEGLTDNVLYCGGSGTLEVNGGTFIADKDTPAGGCCLYDANGGATINAGDFSNSSGGDVWGTTGTAINGGKFENLIETSHVTVGSTIVNGGKTYTMTEDGIVESEVKEEALGKIGIIRNIETTNEAGDARYQAIFLCGIDSLEYKKVGFEVTVAGKTRTIETSTVYTGYVAASQEYAPSDFGNGCEYIFALAINFPTDLASEKVTVKAFYEDFDGNVTYTEEKSWDYIYNK